MVDPARSGGSELFGLLVVVGEGWWVSAVYSQPISVVGVSTVGVVSYTRGIIMV